MEWKYSGLCVDRSNIKMLFTVALTIHLKK